MMSDPLSTKLALLIAMGSVGIPLAGVDVELKLLQ